MGCGCESNDQEIARLSDIVASMQAALAPFLTGHPLQFIQEASDVACFDTTTGWGSGKWEGWHIADGTSQTYEGSTITMFDLRDRVPVGAGISYDVGDAFGEATHMLTPGELPVIAPNLTDPGHTHGIDDSGHNHGLTQSPHTHAAASAAHTHTVTLDGGGHVHPIRIRYRIISEGGVDFNALEASQVENTDNTMYTGAPANTDSGEHEHTGTTDATTSTVDIDDASISISVNDAFTGIDVDLATTGITIDSFGNDEPHNNLQPSSAGFWVQRVAVSNI